MKKTMKTYEAVELCNALSTIAKDKTRKLPGNVAWAVSRTYKQLEEIQKDFNEMGNEKIKAMFEEGKAHEVLDENEQGNIQIPPEHVPEYLQYMNEVSIAEVDIELHTISQETFEKLLDTCELSIPEVEALESFIKTEIIKGDSSSFKE